MKKAFRLIVPVLAVVLCLSQAPRADAASNSINKIEMNVYVESGGAAIVEEIWHVSLSTGTEGYKPYGNLEKSEILGFTVTDDTGTVYETLNKWDTNASFSKKARKCGLNYTSGGVELCWGIGEYGDRTYTLNYRITNFVTQYKDAQAVYFSLIPKEMNQSPDSVVISIASDTPFSESSAKIWAFGYDGEIVFRNGAIVMDSKGRLHSSGYMVALIKFEKDYFDTGDKVNEPFQIVYDRAMEGSDYNGVTQEKILSLLAVVLCAAYAVTSFVVRRRRKPGGRSSFCGGIDTGAEIPSVKKADYWREVPCGKNIKVAYWLIRSYGLASENDSRSGLIGAQLLDWLRGGHIQITKLPKKLLSLKDNNYAVDLRSLKLEGTAPEYRLADILKEAAGDNGILEASCKMNCPIQK